MAGYAVTFSVVDNATKQIDAINRRIAQTRAPLERLSKTVARFVDVSGLRTIANGFGMIARTAMSAAKAIFSIIPGLGAITGAATIAGVVELTKNWAAFDRATRESADNIGITADELTRMQNAARLAGGHAEDATSSMEGLHKTMRDLKLGQGDYAQTYRWLQELHIDPEKAKTRNLSDLLLEVVDNIAKMGNAGDRTAASTALLGDSHAKLAEDVRQSGKPLTELWGASGKFAALTAEQHQQLEDLSESLGKLGVSWDNMASKAAAAIANRLTPVLDHIATFIQDNQPQIIAAVDNISKHFTDALQFIWNHLNDIKTIAEAIATIFVARWAGDIVLAIGKVTGVLGTAGGAEGALAMGGTGLIGALAVIAGIAALLARKDVVPPAPPGPDASPAERALWLRNRMRFDVGAALLPAPGTPPGPRNLVGLAGGQAGAIAPAGPLNLSQTGMDRAVGIRDRLMRDLGLSAGGAAGLVGNLTVETAGITGEQERNPQGGGRGGIGWAQWTGPRRNDFEAYQRAHPTQSWDEQNYGFLTQELQSPENAAVLARLRSGNISAGEAADVVEQGYERPAPGSSSRRESAAGDIYRQPPMAAPPVAAPAVPSPPGGPASASLNGAVDINITHRNPPPDAAVTAQGTGAVNVAPPRVEYQSLAGP